MQQNTEQRFSTVKALATGSDPDKPVSEPPSALSREELLSTLPQHVLNPLAGMKGALEILSHRGELGSEGRAIVAEILTRVGMLCEDFQKLGLFAQPLKPQLAWVSLRQILRSTATRVQAHFEHITLTVAETDVRVLADVEMLAEAFLLLCQNSAEAMGSRGSITLSIVPSPDSTQVCIQDEGPGLDPACSERVFQPFFSTKPRRLGLGLPLARRFFEAHGWQLQLDQGAVGGARFSIYLNQRVAQGLTRGTDKPEHSQRTPRRN